MNKTKRREYDVVTVEYSLLYDATIALMETSHAVQLDATAGPRLCFCRECGSFSTGTNPDRIPHQPRCVVQRMRNIVGLKQPRGKRRTAR